MKIKQIAIFSFLFLAFVTAYTMRQGVFGNSQPERSAEFDRQALINSEKLRLTANDAPTLERILDSDFVHPVSTGDLTSLRLQRKHCDDRKKQSD